MTRMRLKVTEFGEGETEDEGEGPLELFLD
jgi:hypothetical protein